MPARRAGMRRHRARPPARLRRARHARPVALPAAVPLPGPPLAGRPLDRGHRRRRPPDRRLLPPRPAQARPETTDMTHTGGLVTLYAWLIFAGLLSILAYLLLRHEQDPLQDLSRPGPD